MSMPIKNKKYAAFVISLFLLSGTIAFATTALAALASPKAQENGSGVTHDTKVTTLKEASAEAGYRVATLAFVPEGYVQGPTFVSEHANESRGKFVLQQWYDPGTYANILFIHHKGPSLLSNSEPFQIAGMPGYRTSPPLTESRPFEFVIYLWYDVTSDDTFLLLGSLEEGVDEATLQDVAASVTFSY